MCRKKKKALFQACLFILLSVSQSSPCHGIKEQKKLKDIGQMRLFQKISGFCIPVGPAKPLA
jgi:hypothetical protein